MSWLVNKSIRTFRYRNCILVAFQIPAQAATLKKSRGRAQALSDSASLCNFP